jgi:penicillin-binding protein 1B
MEARRIIVLSAIPTSLQQAVLAAEDARFYSHFGIDVVGIARALVRNLREWRFAQGGSTITQQLAKNFFLSPKKTIGRKLREAELALALELRYPKKTILEMYLNKIYFGQEGARGIYGVEEAADFYFSKRAADRRFLPRMGLGIGFDFRGHQILHTGLAGLKNVAGVAYTATPSYLSFAQRVRE